jgi:hypothetical protein
MGSSALQTGVSSPTFQGSVLPSEDSHLCLNTSLKILKYRNKEYVKNVVDNTVTTSQHYIFEYRGRLFWGESLLPLSSEALISYLPSENEEIKEIIILPSKTK